MNTSHCRVCFQPKTPDYYSANECKDCTDLKIKAAAAIKAANPDISDSDLLYAQRQALNERAGHAHSNFVDPRAFSASRGLIPVPPQSS